MRADRPKGEEGVAEVVVKRRKGGGNERRDVESRGGNGGGDVGSDVVFGEVKRLFDWHVIHVLGGPGERAADHDRPG